ncbi:nicotinate-nucleotide adenylyltransferase [Legionella micdadei]|uniref:Probable nicotinate-nucleotide adenylyltransferase n=1 Tax=Legionella micdadei TaxID=451 RepID=A0A098GEE7_LEGMI|nr:nicotinate-nucleotide adenylyltransferase [Legionella micdadei]KTD27665.1 nicotinate-nucleotide adenylyltransferase NadD [Legionella micdadei]NSL17649.1 nicotinate-nucleotide adenylyltransferase [Legionella micdadei]CEG60849.1 putative nicotinate-nucleotide adenylyltransferase [Legionella micdadei]SCY15084.1 nicotinate-nucleotide adenylyltransferase [Legionella micdadei]
MRNLVIYGGTFDPPHNGHINTAINVQNHFNFDCFLFLPCKTPVLKNHAVATPEQRIQMLKLALASQSKQNNFKIDLSEIHRATPSYMVDSLQHFRKEYGENVAITLLMGADAFSQLPRWHAWRKLLTLANLLVIKRAGFTEETNDALIKALLLKHETHDDTAMTKQPHGLIYRFDAGNFNFSSTWIREQLGENRDLTDFLPQAVIRYIKRESLYSKQS